MENVNWTLELIRIGIPVLLNTVFVGLIISRNTERYKSKLALEQYRYQDFYPRMTATIATLYRQLVLVERSLDLAYRVATEDLYKEMPEARLVQFENNASEALRLTRDLDESYAGVRILLDPESVKIFDGVIDDVSTAAKFISALSLTGRGGLQIVAGDEERMWNKLNEILRDGFPRRKKELESHVHSITQA